MQRGKSFDMLNLLSGGYYMNRRSNNFGERKFVYKLLDRRTPEFTRDQHRTCCFLQESFGPWLLQVIFILPEVGTSYAK